MDSASEEGLPYRKQGTRKRKYKLGVIPDVVESKLSSLKPMMQDGQERAQAIIVRYEKAIREVLDDEGISANARIDYLNFGRKLIKYIGRHSGLALTRTIAVEKAKYEALGLDSGVLDEISATVLGVYAEVPTPPEAPPDIPPNLVSLWLQDFTDSTQRKTFAKNFSPARRHWVFWYNMWNHVIDYASSLDGTTWTDKTAVAIDGDVALSENFSLAFDGTYIHLAYLVFPETCKLKYMRGTPNLDGSITFTEEHMAFEIWGTLFHPNITLDSEGHAWIGFWFVGEDHGANGFHAWATKNANTDGTWLNAVGFPYEVFFLEGLTETSARVVPVALTNSKMLVIVTYVMDPQTFIVGFKYDGANWGVGPEPIGNDEIASALPNAFSAVADGDYVMVVWKGIVMGDKDGIWWRGWTWDAGSGIFSYPDCKIVESDAVTAPVLSKVGTHDFRCFWARNDTYHVHYSKFHWGEGENMEGIWDAEPTDWIDESVKGVGDNMSAFYEKYANYIGLAYMTLDLSGPKHLKYAALGFA